MRRRIAAVVILARIITPRPRGRSGDRRRVLTREGYFLDVQCSALGRPWRSRLDADGELRALAIAQIGGQDELIARVLAGRGVKPEAVAISIRACAI